jgi:hypothetical protein
VFLHNALEIYQQGIGFKNLKCAKCWEELAKINIIRESYREASENLEHCLLIKRELYRYKPNSREMLKTHHLIEGLAKLIAAK